jgi:hypothetical protein
VDHCQGMAMSCRQQNRLRLLSEGKVNPAICTPGFHESVPEVVEIRRLRCHVPVFLIPGDLEQPLDRHSSACTLGQRVARVISLSSALKTDPHCSPSISGGISIPCRIPCQIEQNAPTKNCYWSFQLSMHLSGGLLAVPFAHV